MPIFRFRCFFNTHQLKTIAINSSITKTTLDLEFPNSIPDVSTAEPPLKGTYVHVNEETLRLGTSVRSQVDAEMRRALLHIHSE